VGRWGEIDDITRRWCAFVFSVEIRGVAMWAVEGESSYGQTWLLPNGTESIGCHSKFKGIEHEPVRTRVRSGRIHDGQKKMLRDVSASYSTSESFASTARGFLLEGGNVSQVERKLRGLLTSAHMSWAWETHRVA
jgi:hypothetical protein